MTSQFISWDQYFMTLAYLVSMKSKDPSTRVGAVIVGPDHEIISTGYNGLPRRVKDAVDRYQDRDFKYLASNHAEENAILQCAKLGVPTSGSTIYVPWIPCCSCAKSIIQVGIVEVVYDENFPGNNVRNQENWHNSIALSKEIMIESGIEIRSFSDSLIKIEGLFKERNFSLF